MGRIVELADRRFARRTAVCTAEKRAELAGGRRSIGRRLIGLLSLDWADDDDRARSCASGWSWRWHVRSLSPVVNCLRAHHFDLRARSACRITANQQVRQVRARRLLLPAPSQLARAPRAWTVLAVARATAASRSCANSRNPPPVQRVRALARPLAQRTRSRIQTTRGS